MHSITALLPRGHPHPVDRPLAELAWRKKNYQEVRRLMAQLPAEGQSPLVNALQRYWTQTA